MHNPLVSVIIPNYCHAKYLDQRIQSVLDQTYQNFEIIILDDCSPDNGASRAVIEKYRSNPHVTHIEYNETNSGSTFKQWNKGFSLAKGDLIWIAESDDFCKNTLLDTLVSEFEKDKNCALAYVKSQFVNQDGCKIQPIHPESEQVKRFDGKYYVNKYLSADNPIMNASSAIFKKEYAVNADKYYMTYKGGGDRLFWILIALRGNVVFCKSPLNYFRRHGTTVTDKCSIDGTNSREAYKTYQYLVSHKILSKKWAIISKWRYQVFVRQWNFETEVIKHDVLALWGIDHGFISYMFKRCVIKVIKLLIYKK